MNNKKKPGMKISACIDMMFTYCDFYQRIPEAKKYGIETVEFWKWSNKDIDKIVNAGSKVSVFNIDSRDKGLSYDLSRGILNDGRAEEFIRALRESIPVYKRLNAEAMIVLIGENKAYNEKNIIKCLTAAIPILEAEEVRLVIEPLNNIDRPGYSMPYMGPIFSLVRGLESPYIKVLYDIYHQHRMGDFSLEKVCENIDIIGHFHVAGCPGRHEPDIGDVVYSDIFRAITKTAYDGYFGLEYRATKPDGETLGFLKEVENV